ncbi:large ribosomal subunit protein eL14 isoform X2 [Hetaerina americana]|uniref:large ribosomal subunit protein eL14 isoform X1 n=1 Tax=Hetaerina americana TaxID=62018 RepID=UPI003A7F5936
MPFKKFVETGRVAYIAYGPLAGKLCAIVDVIDQTRALVDGPCTGVPRTSVRFNELHLTKFRINFPFSAATRNVRKAWTAAKIDEKWAESAWAKKIEARKKRLSMTDFDRFKLGKARQVRNRIRTNAYFTLKKKQGARLFSTKKSAKAREAAKKKTPPKKEKAEGKKPVAKKAEGKKVEAKKAETK